MMGARTTLMAAQGLTSLQLPSLPEVSALQGMTSPPTQRHVFCPVNSQTTESEPVINCPGCPAQTPVDLVFEPHTV